VGLYFKKEVKIGRNPMKGEDVSVLRNVLKIDRDLPMKDEYSAFISGVVDPAGF
jgi:hypothetical protein